MSIAPSIKVFERWQNSDGSADFLQLVQPDGNVLGWIDPSGILSGSLIGSAVGQSATISLTPTQIQNLGTTAVQILPAPGIGKYIHVLAGQMNLQFKTTPYGVSSGPGNISVIWGTNQLFPILNNTPPFITSSQSVIAVSPSVYGGFVSTNVNIPIAANLPLNVTAGTGTVFTAGDGVLSVTVWYQILSVA